MDALEPFRVKGPEQSPEPLPYLQQKGEKAFDINLEVIIKPENSEETVVFVQTSNICIGQWRNN